MHILIMRTSFLKTVQMMGILMMMFLDRRWCYSKQDGAIQSNILQDEGIDASSVEEEAYSGSEDDSGDSESQSNADCSTLFSRSGGSTEANGR